MRLVRLSAISASMLLACVAEVVLAADAPAVPDKLTVAPVVDPAVPDSTPANKTEDSTPAPFNQADALLNQSQSLLKDLTLTEDQRQKIDRLIQTARTDLQRLQKKIPDKAQREAALAAMKLQVNAILKDYHDQVAAILTPEQQKRLDQFSIKVRGWSAVNDDSIAAQLKLTDEQRDKVQELIQSFRSDQREALHDIRREFAQQKKAHGQAARRARHEKREEFRRELDAHIRAVLTPEQVAQFEGLQNNKAVRDVRPGSSTSPRGESSAGSSGAVPASAEATLGGESAPAPKSNGDKAPAGVKTDDR